MHGMQCFPSLLHADPSMASMLKDYEILGCGPLRDLKHQIENLYTEFPRHLNKVERKLMEDIIYTSLENKETKRGVDYRKSLVKLNIYLRDKINTTVFQILSTLCEVQGILYAAESERSIEKILRLHNQIFLHACLIKELVRSKTKSLTKCVLWGKYYHAIVCHVPIMYRLISGRSAHAELEERMFHTLKVITKGTSNQHPGHVILNNMVHLQVGQELNISEVSREDNEVSKICRGLHEKTNSVVPFWIIDKYHHEWQAHLEHVADYINEKCWWRKTDDGIMFFDCKKNENSELKPHHFRSSNVKAELTHLKACWEKRVTETSYIPARKILIEESDEEVTTRKLHTILFFEDPIMEDSVVSSSSSLAVPEKVILENTHHFPPYKRNKTNMILIFWLQMEKMIMPTYGYEIYQRVARRMKRQWNQVKYLQ